MSQVRTLITAEQLLKMGPDCRMELVRGELVEMTPVNYPHSRLVVRLSRWMDAFAEKQKLGAVGTELGFILARDPDVVRAPDVYFLSASRLKQVNPEGFFEGAPDLAVEVLSPDDRASEVQEKVREYLSAGTRLVWVADPRSKTVTAYKPSGDARVYSGSEEVTGEDVLPGFSFRPADLFRLD